MIWLIFAGPVTYITYSNNMCSHNLPDMPAVTSQACAHISSKSPLPLLCMRMYMLYIIIICNVIRMHMGSSNLHDMNT